MESKNLTIKKNVKISICNRSSESFLLYKYKNLSASYIKIPFGVVVSWLKSCGNVNIVYSTKNEKHQKFWALLNEQLTQNFTLTKKKIVLKGTGYKIFFNDDSQSLEFKLGYSHNVSLAVPLDKLNVSIVKNSICLESLDKSFLGNFCRKIIRLKEPNSYKDKGLFFKNQKHNLKTIKKK